ncbi:MAG: HAD-IA family hydrolase, partial [Chloroflexota bacterium]|nr:HAD-IA family hydrolase [Chloroflexota bacterium]
MPPKNFDAVIFDLDGVITNTASLHSIAWKQMFDNFLKTRAEESGTPFREFTHEDDYLPYVDGKPRYKGVASFLESRGIELPYGSPDDPPGQGTVCELGNNKNKLFSDLIKGGNVEVFETTVNFVHDLHAANIKVGVASSSKNAKVVLEAAGLLSLIETRVDGVVSAELGLAGKPQPDIFTTACDNLGAHYDRSVVVEDAISGVQAGKKGGFGLVIGVAREDNVQELKSNGADIVVTDMAEINLERIQEWFAKDLENKKWGLEYSDYSPKKEGVRETLLTVGNGYFGTRGALEETSANDTNYPGTYIAGLYNRLPSPVSERMVYNEDFVNAPNWLPITFRVGDGDWFNPNETEILHITRRLDFRDGTLTREMTIRDAQGHETQITSQRFANMANPHTAALRYTITPLGYTQPITIRSGLDGTIINAGVNRYRDLSSKHLEIIDAGGDENTTYLRMKTTQSEIEITEAAKLSVFLEGETLPAGGEVVAEPGAVFSSLTVNAAAGQTITVEKVVAIHTSHAQEPETPSPLESALQKLETTPGY